MKNKRLKADSVLGVCLLCVALTILGDAVAQPINKLGDSFEDTIPELYTICYYFATIGCWVVALLFMTVFKPDRELMNNAMSVMQMAYFQPRFVYFVKVLTIFPAVAKFLL